MTLDASWLSWPETQALIRAFPEDALRFVGGAVRDTLLGVPVQDIDAATPLTPDEVTKLLEKDSIKAVPTGIEHGTITAVVSGKPFQITTLRKDVATDGRHAEVAYTDDWQEDAARRDFTINALYLSLQGTLYDYFGGETDLREGRVAFIGDPAARIAEDYLRILRFFRFFAHYGKTAPDPAALAACSAAAAHLETLSAERIQHEMLKLLATPKSYHAIGLMFETNILTHALGFTLTTRAPLRRLEEIATTFTTPATIAAKCAALLDSGKADPEAFIARLKLSNALSREIKMLIELSSRINASLDEAAQKKLIRLHGNATFAQAVMLAWACGDDIIENTHPLRVMLTLAANWQAPTFLVTGDDLKARGLAEGKQLGDTLRALEEAWEKSDYRLSKEELLTDLSSR